jgi:hypothetical protein
MRALINEAGDLLQIGFHKGFVDSNIAVTFAQKDLNLFYDSENPETEHESMMENLHKIQIDFDKFYQEIDSYTTPEDYIVELVERYKYSKKREVNSSEMQQEAPKYGFGVFKDQSRIYYGEFQLEETES